MKKVFLFLLAVSFSSVCFADFYVLYDNATKQVLDIGVRDDAVAENGQSKEAVKEVIAINYPMQFYKFKKGKVEFDAKAYNEWQIQNDKDVSEAQAIASERAAVEKKVKEMAYDYLVSEGMTFEKLKKEDL